MENLLVIALTVVALVTLLTQRRVEVAPDTEPQRRGGCLRPLLFGLLLGLTLAVVLNGLFTLRDAANPQGLVITRRDSDFREEPTPPPTTAPSSIESLLVVVSRAMNAAAPNNHQIELDKEEKLVTIIEWADGFNVAAANLSLERKDKLDSWNDSLASGVEFCNLLQSVLDDNGHPEYTGVFKIVNCDDHAQVFAVIARGSILFDIVDATPAGERISAYTEQRADGASNKYIANTATGTFHLPDCAVVAHIFPQHVAVYHGTHAQMVAEGFHPCAICDP